MQNRQSTVASARNNNNKENSAPVKDAKYGRYVFSSIEFSGIMSTYQNFTFEYRIKNAFEFHSQQEGSNYIVYLYWEDSEKHYHPLKVTLKCDDEIRPGYSRFLSDSRRAEFYKDQFNLKFEPQQKIYSLRADLITSNNMQFYEEYVLLMWFTLDGTIGELSHIEAGSGLSGTEVLRIYEYFAKFLRVSHMMICDDAALFAPRHNVYIPLRLITAIADEKTWLEKHISRMRLMDGRIPVNNLNTLDQKGLSRNKCLNELQALHLSAWKKMMTLEQQQKLQMLFDHCFQEKNSKQTFSKFFARKKENENRNSLESVTLQKLVSAIYAESKASGEVTNNLITLNELLCGNIDAEFGNVPISKKSPDFWVKSRVQQLLWGSYVWKQMTEKDESQSRNNLVITGSMLI